MDKKMKNRRIGILSTILLAIVIVVFFVARFNISQKEQAQSQTATNSEVGTEDTTEKTGETGDEAAVTEAVEFTVYMTIECDALADYEVAGEVKDIIPEDYQILKKTEIKAEAGDTVYDLLGKTCRDMDIQLESSYNTEYDSYYIEAIGHLYEGVVTDAAYSGWTFTVDGEMPMVGASEILLEGGEDIVWSYSVFDSFE